MNKRITVKTFPGCLYLTEEEASDVYRQIEQALSDLRWAERTVVGTNFRASIYGLEAAKRILASKA